MDYTVRQSPPEQQATNPDRYELFETATMKSPSGSDVEVLKSIGIFSVADLQQRKSYLLAEITEIDNKLTAIATIQNPA
ncbi:MAG: hypothetical protein ACOYN4_17130 [Bacteroidales bacterium]